MQEYQPSKLLKTIIKQSNVETEIPPKKFKVNPNYIPPEIKQLEKQQSESNIHEKNFELDDFIPVSKPPARESKQTQQQQQPQQKIHTSTMEEEDSLQMIPIHAPIKEFNHMRPVIIGEQEEQMALNQLPFLEALREGICILQLPNKLPFHDLGKQGKQQEEVNKKDPALSVLKEFYNDCYDSSGFPLTKQYTQMSCQKNIGISLGKIVVGKDGKVQWKAGREEFDIEPGIAQTLDQKCLMVNTEENKCGFIEIGQKFLVKPNY